MYTAYIVMDSSNLLRELYAGDPVAFLLEELERTNPGVFAFLHFTSAGKLECSVVGKGMRNDDTETVRGAITRWLEHDLGSSQDVADAVVSSLGVGNDPSLVSAGRERGADSYPPDDFIRFRTGEETTGVLSIVYPAPEQRRMRPETLALLTTIAPHLGTAWAAAMHRSLACYEQLLTIVDVFHGPAFLSTAEPTIIKANAAAQQYLASVGEDPLDAMWRHGDGVVASLAEQLEAEDSTSGVVSCRDSAGNFVIVEAHRTGWQPCCASVDTAARRDLGLAQPVLLFHLRVAPSVADDIAPEAVRALGITPAELRLLLRLLNGSTLQETAEHFGVSYNTLRNQLASLSQKTGLRTQADIVRFFVPLKS